MKSVFLRVLDAEDKGAALRQAAAGLSGVGSARRYEVSVGIFGRVPGSPFSYWAPEELLSVFHRLPSFDAGGRMARAGAATIDDARFVRSWFEIKGRSWVPLAKGGRRAPFYSDVHFVVQWSGGGAQLKAFASAYRERKGWGDQWTAVLNGHGLYFRPGLTWPHRSATFSVAALPSGCIFTKSGKAAFAPDDQLGPLLAIMNSATATLLLRLQSDAVRIKFEAGLVERLPIPDLSAADSARLRELSRRAWAARRSLDTREEISHAFVLPALLQVKGATLAERTPAWEERAYALQAELQALQQEIDTQCRDLYGVGDTKHDDLLLGSQPVEEGEADVAMADGSEGEGLEEEEAAQGTESTGLAAELLSWFVGVAFGRFEWRLATGARALPQEPEIFDPLPACSPGMFGADDCLPLAKDGDPVRWPGTGILVDDSGHPQDLTARLRVFFEAVFGPDAARWWGDLAEVLDSKNRDLRTWLANDFFDYHLKRHSRSPRKAPILWQLSVPSGKYGVWLYAHRLSADSFFQIQNELVGTKLSHEERRLTSLIQDAGASPSASERKEIAGQETFVDELRTMLDEVKRIAPLWNPNLDDGVVLTMAPLWRLVPQHKPWQKELAGKWAELAAGKYDWAHIAMHLWPERVVPKCATDRSLAIAHGLEEVFWVETKERKWGVRNPPTRSIGDLVQERTSPAVKAALKSLLDAPSPSGVGNKSKKDKGHA